MNELPLEIEKFIMRVSLILALFFLFSVVSNAQENQENKVATRSFYLLPDFKEARILFKTGLEKNAVFNYNVVTEEMVYNNQGEFMALEMPGIDTIYLAGKKFIPFGKIFYEVVSAPPALLFVRHHSKLINRGKPVGYGGYSQTAATTSLTSVTTNGTFYKLEVPAEFDLNDITSILISRGKQFYEINNTRQLLKAYPEKKAVIKDYVKEHKIDYNNPEDVIKFLLVLQQ